MRRGYPKSILEPGIPKRAQSTWGQAGNMADFARLTLAKNILIGPDLSGGEGSSSKAKQKPAFRSLNLRKRSDWEFRVFIEYSYG